jgi:predicted DCC family thiol-disulfide oxidoreductase YuxK
MDRPLLLYDGHCGFCGIWVRYWQRLTGGRVAYAPAQEAAAQFPEISSEDFKRSVWLVQPDGTRFSGARAAFELMAHAPGKTWPLWWYRHVPGFASLAESSYRQIAGHRDFFYGVTRLFWGREIYPSTWRLTRSVFLKGLAIVFLVAFLSMIPQIAGLIGQNGISPIGEYLEFVRSHTGLERYWLLPSLTWLHSSDAFLLAICWAGSGLAVALLLGFAPLYALIGLFVLYLSIVSAGQEFLSFQWDVLLLEAAFAAMLIAPRAILPRHARPAGMLGIWVLRLLTFRLMLESGLVKLLSGDPSWRHLTALNFHYETQPLPTPLGWYAHQLPDWFQKLSTGGVFAMELVVPFLFLMPRRLRIIGAWMTIVFQLLIAATGNYTFFNLLTIVLCLTMFDDRHLQRFLPEKVHITTSQAVPHRRTANIAAGVLMALGLLQLGQTSGVLPEMPEPVSLVLASAENLHVVNGYGLFAVMTTSRPEIIIEGSNDGENWQSYDFKYKAGGLHDAPHWAAPYQPRLDWQMWFVALSGYPDSPWFGRLAGRLLEGSPPVIALLARNPFPDKPPQYIRASLYEYRFTSLSERRATGNWWARTYAGPYLPAVRLR